MHKCVSFMIFGYIHISRGNLTQILPNVNIHFNYYIFINGNFCDFTLIYSEPIIRIYIEIGQYIWWSSQHKYIQRLDIIYMNINQKKNMAFKYNRSDSANVQFINHWQIQSRGNDLVSTVETLYNTISFCWSTHKRHSIARPKGRGMGCLLWVQRATYCVDLSILSSIKYLLL